MPIALIVHGGAWDIPATEHTAHMTGCKAALLAGFARLQTGANALDAVETAVTLLEDDPAFDAGIGSHLNQDGVVQLDAGLMDGETLQVGAVAAVERLPNPIRVCRRLLNSRHNFMVGPGAETYAREQGFALCEPTRFVVPREQERWQAAREGQPAADPFGSSGKSGTVGAVAIDRAGRIAAATSTGGTLFKPAGRVGDSPLPGCGYYADNALAGVSTTGHGESIIRVQLARVAADFCARLNAPAAAEAAISVLRDRVGGRGGVILIDHAGRIGLAHNTPHMAYAFLSEDMAAPEIGI